jgi:hypothetical protein
MSTTRPLDSSHDDEIAESFSSIVAEADEQDRQDFEAYEAGNLNNKHLKVQDVIPEAPQSPLTNEENKTASPEQDASQIEPSFTPETELDDGQAPVETQQTPLALEQPRVPGETFETAVQESESEQKPAGFKQFGAGIPPKHLAHLDVDAKQAEQDWASRP